MCYFEKVLLHTYPHLLSIIGDMDKLVTQKAYSSFACRYSCYELSEKMINIISNKDKLIKLKLRLDDIICNLTDEEQWLLEYKYFKRKNRIKMLSSKVHVDYSLRTYFRKQNRVFEKFSKYLNLQGMTESWFLDNFSEIDWFSSLYNRLKNDEKNKKKFEQKEKIKHIA